MPTPIRSQLACLVTVLVGACIHDPMVPLGGDDTGSNSVTSIWPGPGARQLAVDVDYLYWLSWNIEPPVGWQGPESAVVEVTRADKYGADAVVLGRVGQRFDERQGRVDTSFVLHVAAGDAYFTDTTFIAKARRDGTGVDMIVPSVDTLQGLALDSTTIYYSTASAIHSVPKTGGAPAVIASDLLIPRRLAVDSTHIYVVDDFPQFTLNRVGKSGGTLTDLATAGYGTPLVVDGSDIYFNASGVNRRVPKGGGPSTVIVGDNITGEFAVDANHVYAIRERATIVKVDKATYETTTLVEGGSTYPRILSIAVDDTKVYWSTEQGTINWTAK